MTAMCIALSKKNEKIWIYLNIEMVKTRAGYETEIVEVKNKSKSWNKYWKGGMI